MENSPIKNNSSFKKKKNRKAIVAKKLTNLPNTQLVVYEEKP
jgi:hypothetical protein